jgi:hypothetical protein
MKLCRDIEKPRSDQRLAGLHTLTWISVVFGQAVNTVLIVIFAYSMLALGSKRGPNAGSAEGYTLIDLYTDGSYETQYVEYGWQA